MDHQYGPSDAELTFVRPGPNLFEMEGAFMGWEEIVVGLVSVWWNEQKKPYPLSRLKPDLRNRHVDLDEKLGGRKAREVMEIDFRDRLKVFHHPNHELVWYMIPVLTDSNAAIGALTTEEPNKPLVSTVEYEKAVFTAFIKRLEEGKRRFLFFGDRTYFDDIQTDPVTTYGGLEVMRSDISVPVGELLTDVEKRETSQRIQAWLKNNDIELTKVTVQNRSESKAQDRASVSDVLDFSGLTASEKARILIPLDLLFKIRFGR